MKISVILPVLNEAKLLPNTLKAIFNPYNPALEIIVVDGGSSDASATLAKKFTPKVILSPPGRGAQMNAGAALAEGEVFLFLHADSRIGPGGLQAVRSGLEKTDAVGGAFRLGIDSRRWSLKIISFFANIRTQATGIPYGDQGIFVRRTIFQKVGGFKNIPLLEDLEFCGRLKREGSLLLLSDTLWTSPRRWEKEGILKVTFRNQLILGFYCLGVSPIRLARWYQMVR